jgi:hypothetical protein
MFFEADCGHKNRGCLEYFLLQKGLYSYVRTTVVWHIFRGVVQQRRSYNSTDLAQISRQKGVGLLGVVSGFLLLEIVILLLIYFPEANKISLSLGFPTLGFSLAGCLNF